MTQIRYHHDYIETHRSHVIEEREGESLPSISSHVYSSKTKESTRTTDAASRGDAICKYCQAKTDQAHKKFWFRTSDDSDYDNNLVQMHRTVCPSCGWWSVSDSVIKHLNYGDIKCDNNTVTEGIIQTFNVDSLDVPMDALREHLIQSHADLQALHPRKMELLVQSVMRDWFHCEVRHVGGPNDGGIDLYAVINANPVLIQVKRRSSSRYTEGVGTVRNLLGALIANGAHRGIVVSTAHQFSRQATELSRRDVVQKLNISIDLIGFRELCNMLDITTQPSVPPWVRLFDEVCARRAGS